MRGRWLAIIVAACSLTGCGTPSIEGGGYVPVARVIDGDTVVVGDETIRVIGIDSPETKNPRVKPECGGQEATDYAKGLLEGRRVKVVQDPTQGQRDGYQRLLAYLDVEGLDDYGAIMISKGLAKEYLYKKPYARQLKYQDLETYARDRALGTWGQCGGFDKPQG